MAVKLSRYNEKLDQFHLRCLRKVIGISREDRVSNKELLRRANMLCIEALIGHVVRTDDARLPKMVFFSELATGARSIRHPLKRFKHSLKQETELNPILG